MLADIAHELARPSEESELVLRQRNTVGNLELGQFNRTDEIRQLEQLVLLRLHALRKFNPRSEFGEERVLKKFRDGRLSAIIIDLYRVNASEISAPLIEEIAQLALKTFDNLPRRRDELLVHDKAMELEIHLTCERQHPRENRRALLSRHVHIALLLADQRPRMKAEVFIPHQHPIGIELANKRTDIHALIMQNKTYDVKARNGIGVLELPRFVDKHAQNLFLHILTA